MIVQTIINVVRRSGQNLKLFMHNMVAGFVGFESFWY